MLRKHLIASTPLRIGIWGAIVLTGRSCVAAAIRLLNEICADTAPPIGVWSADVAKPEWVCTVLSIRSDSR